MRVVGAERRREARSDQDGEGGLRSPVAALVDSSLRKADKCIAIGVGISIDRSNSILLLGSATGTSSRGPTRNSMAEPRRLSKTIALDA